MKTLLAFGIALAVVVATFIGGYYAGLRDGLPKHAVEEFKMCYVNLTHGGTNLAPQTREYLKERLYWNAVVHIPAGFFPEYRFDFGPIEESTLAGARGIKDCSTSREVYDDAMSKHGQKGKHPTKPSTPSK